MDENTVMPEEGSHPPFHCSTCGNENPYVIGKVTGQDCAECLDSEEYMDSLIEE